MDNSSLVSVIIPVFNVRPFLSEALDSVIQQTYKNLEIILIDDGSRDGSEKICDEYAGRDERIVVIHQENKGLSAARNAGLDIMSGDAIVFLDPDDAFQPDYIKAMMTEMICQEADLVICKFAVLNSTGKMTKDDSKQRLFFTSERKTIPPIKSETYDRRAALRALAKGIVNHTVWNKLYSRKLWEVIRFPEGHVYEDMDTTYKLFNLCDRICVLDQILYLHRIRSGSITNTCANATIEDCNIAFMHFEEFIRGNVPNVFAIEDLKKAKWFQNNRLINFYLLLSRKTEGVEKGLRNDLRNQIIKIGDETGIQDCSIRRKVLYHMICHCPWLLRIVYPIYHSMRHAIKKVVKERSYL